MPALPRSVAAAVAVLLLAACASAPPPVATQPAFVDELIATFEAEPVANPPASIREYRYRGALVYYVPARCCDIPSQVYTTDGAPLCQPDGGFSGRGDGQCPDFAAERTDERLIWRDARE
jgi:hypothetical protein